MQKKSSMGADELKVGMKVRGDWISQHPYYPSRWNMEVVGISDRGVYLKHGNDEVRYVLFSEKDSFTLVE